MKEISLDGKYVIELSKSIEAEKIYWHFTIFKKFENGTVSPLCDAPVTLLQQNEEMGLQFELDSKNLFIENNPSK